MPLFFTISGLFAVNAVRRPWPVQALTRVAKFGYPGNRGGVYQNLGFFLGGMYGKSVLEQLAAKASWARLAVIGVPYAFLLGLIAVFEPVVLTAFLVWLCLTVRRFLPGVLFDLPAQTALTASEGRPANVRSR